ncbi:MAG: adenylate/guanylate cyclase domain-containing protein [Anaerolineae bacterium]
MRTDVEVNHDHSDRSREKSGGHALPRCLHAQFSAVLHLPEGHECLCTAHGIHCGYEFSVVEGVYLETLEEAQAHVILSRYLDPQVVKEILERHACLAECCIREQEVTILFADIRGFTALSEHLKAKELVGFLNRFYGVMTKVVQSTRGVSTSSLATAS